jgi:Lon protease-like protein
MPDSKPPLAPRIELPIFPLPDLVVFPGMRVPLHIFEPRYRRLTEDVLAADRKLAIAVLEPGFETDYFDSPPIWQLVATCLIESSRRLPDGRFLLALVGEGRGRVEQELPREDCPYRRARIELRPPDRPSPALASAVEGMRERVARLRATSDAPGGWIEAESTEDAGSPGRALDWIHLVASTLPLSVDTRLELFAIDDPMGRARVLERELERLERWQGVLTRRRPPSNDLRLN